MKQWALGPIHSFLFSIFIFFQNTYNLFSLQIPSLVASPKHGTDAPDGATSSMVDVAESDRLPWLFIQFALGTRTGIFPGLGWELGKENPANVPHARACHTSTVTVTVVVGFTPSSPSISWDGQVRSCFGKT